MKHKLHDRCSNNQAEQMAIFEALQVIETIKINNNTPRTIMIHADNRITMESLKNRTRMIHTESRITMKSLKNRTIMIHTDSRITMESLKNRKNRNHLIEEIRKKTIALEKEKWDIENTWIKAHAGHYGNELADKLAKKAARNSDICYNKIPKSETEHQEREKSIEKWQ
jgi:ribonuclease HI